MTMYRLDLHEFLGEAKAADQWKSSFFYASVTDSNRLEHFKLCSSVNLSLDFNINDHCH